MTNPEEFKQQPIQPRQGDLSLVCEFCKMQVPIPVPFPRPHVDHRPLIESLQSKERLYKMLLQKAGPEKLAITQGLDGEVKRLHEALSRFVAGNAEANDRAIIRLAPDVLQKIENNVLKQSEAFSHTNMFQAIEAMGGEGAESKSQTMYDMALQEYQAWKTIREKSENLSSQLENRGAELNG